jgi:hypothetical protein
MNDAQGQYKILDSNHIQFKIVEARKLPTGLSYVNEFSVILDKLTLSIVKNRVFVKCWGWKISGGDLVSLLL